MQLDHAQRAQILIEALPYIQKYNNKIIVIKYGGNAMINEELKEAVMGDIVLLSLIGVKVVLVHGGGPEITDMLSKVGKKTEFVGGLRVTRLEVRREVEVQSAEAHHEVEQAVDGADVERAVVPYERIHGRGGTRRSPEFLFRRDAASSGRGEGVLLEAGEHAFPHLGGGLVGEGYGQYLLPAVFAFGIVHGASGRGFFPGRGGRAGKQGEEGAGEGVGLAGAGGGLYLTEFVHALYHPL